MKEGRGDGKYGGSGCSESEKTKQKIQTEKSFKDLLKQNIKLKSTIDTQSIQIAEKNQLIKDLQ